MNVKKIATLGAVLFIGIGLAGCGNNSNKSSSNSQKVSGPLKKVGTYTKDNETGKITLLAIKNYHNKNVKTKAATYYFKEAKLLKIETTKKSQRANDENNFGKKLNNTYYEYQLGYSLKNNSKKRVSSNGVELITPSGNQLSSSHGAIDELVGDKIQPGTKKTGLIQAIAEKEDIKKMNQYKFVSAELIEDSGNYYGVDSQTTINFNK
ncbi:hypothetical protein IMAU70164_03003 [Lactiplantibacillus plantarum]|uniref:hypothetical protein n=1 Tax=Lactiplantibacillus plantarum TaxID=1590 RepID=UPI0021A31479|nr:hypothetical protein [Lactiplantibacillus plantarum]MCG0798649.1 hypothetical protein [Lactiplantibacillus plantarum]